MTVNEMIFYEKYSEMVNLTFGTNLPWCHENVMYLAYDYCFSIYHNLEELKKDMDVNDQDVNDMFHNDVLGYIGGMFVYFTEHNYDYEEDVPIGEFTASEIKIIKQIQHRSENIIEEDYYKNIEYEDEEYEF